jgi:hypothetical protein
MRESWRQRHLPETVDGFELEQKIKCQNVLRETMSSLGKWWQPRLEIWVVHAGGEVVQVFEWMDDR